MPKVEVKEPQVYSRNDPEGTLYVNDNDGEYLLLVKTGLNRFALIGLESGNRWYDPTNYEEMMKYIETDKLRRLPTGTQLTLTQD